MRNRNEKSLRYLILKVWIKNNLIKNFRWTNNVQWRALEDGYEQKYLH
jgi:hypothetical protein